MALFVGLPACGPTVFEAVDLTCEDARQSVRHGARPSGVESVGTIEVGESIPVLRLERVHRSPDELAERAMAYACFVAGDELRADETLYAWAEEALETPDVEIGAHPFERRDLKVSYDARVDDLRVLLDHETSAPTTGDFDEYGVDVGIGRDAALEVTAEIYGELATDDLVDLAVDLSVPTREGGLAASDGKHIWHVTYGFAFEHQFAGVDVSGSDVWIGVTAQGELYGVSISDQDIALLEHRPAAIDEAQSDEHFDALARQHAPTPEHELRIFPESIGIAYLRWYDEPSRDVGPRLVKAFVFDAPGDESPTFDADDVNVAALSLQDSAGLDFAP